MPPPPSNSPQMYLPLSNANANENNNNNNNNNPALPFVASQSAQPTQIHAQTLEAPLFAPPTSAELLGHSENLESDAFGSGFAPFSLNSNPNSGSNHAFSFTSPAAAHRDFLNILPRPLSALVFLTSSVLLFLTASSSPLSPLCLAPLCFLAPLLLILTKQLWIPAPKDDVLALVSPRSYFVRFSTVSLLWLVDCVAFLALLRGPGPLFFIAAKSFLLPFTSLALSHRLSVLNVVAPRRLLHCLLVAACAVFVFAMSFDSNRANSEENAAAAAAAADAVKTTTTKILDISTPPFTMMDYALSLLLLVAPYVASHAAAALWVEKYMIVFDADPWVLVRNAAPISLLASLILWMLFDRTQPTGHFAHALRIAMLYAMQLLSGTFILRHVSAFAAASFVTYVRDAAAVLALWTAGAAALSHALLAPLAAAAFGLSVKYYPFSDGFAFASFFSSSSALNTNANASAGAGASANANSNPDGHTNLGAFTRTAATSTTTLYAVPDDPANYTSVSMQPVHSTTTTTTTTNNSMAK